MLVAGVGAETAAGADSSSLTSESPGPCGGGGDQLARGSAQGVHVRSRGGGEGGARTPLRAEAGGSALSPG